MKNNVRIFVSLPAELLVDIFKYCEEYNWPTDPRDEYSPFKESDDRSFLDGETTWIEATSQAKEYICNIRLVCKSFLNASALSFASILGYRRFRLTHTGVKDLLDIGAVATLAPLIKTLSIGAPEFSEHHATAELASLLDGHDIHGEMLSGIHQALQIYVRLNRADEAAARVGLVTAFGAFPNLRNLRIILYDMTDYLGGCFTTERRQYISSNFKPGTDLSRNISKKFEWDEEMMADVLYIPSMPDVTNIVLQAVHERNIGIQDLMFSNDLCPATECVLLPATLHTIRMKVDDTFFPVLDPTHSNTPVPASPLLVALAKMENLQDLTLIREEEFYLGDQKAAHHTAKIFRAVHRASKLRRFDLQGEWETTRTSIVEFVRQHASSLRQLVFHKTWLRESDLLHWLPDSAQSHRLDTLHDVAQLTQGHLEYLRVARVAFVYGEYIYGEDKFNTYTQSQWPHFTCTTDFGPHFRLLPDATELQGEAALGDGASDHRSEEWDSEDESSGDESNANDIVDAEVA